MIPKIRTYPDHSLNSNTHKSIIDTPNYFDSQYNVIDSYKGKSVAEIKKELKKNSLPFAVCFEHWINDFNIATGIRNANGFGASSVFYVGNKKIDKRGTVGCHNYIDVNFIHNFDDIKELKKQFKFVALDNIEGSVDLHSYKWEPNSLMIFGSEGAGITPAMLELCDDIVKIPMRGSVRSFNCGTSSGIVMYDYISKMTYILCASNSNLYQIHFIVLMTKV